MIEELKKGSQAAFRTLVEQYSQKVISTCYSFSNSTDDAEDIAQEVFLEVYRSIHLFKSQAELDTWIYRIAVNKSLDFLRKQKRKKRIADLKQLFQLKNTPQSTPDRHLEQKERKEILKNQIRLLPENQRIALVLSQYDKMSNKQIAEIMRTTESAVESLLHRAREKLKKNLQKYFENDQ